MAEQIKSIGIGADHGGFELKQAIADSLKNQGYQVLDYGTESKQSYDYPDIANPVAIDLQNGLLDRAILFCTSGVGMSLAANRFSGVRATLIRELEECETARLHNNINILCLGKKQTSLEQALKLIETFLTTPFEGGRHEARLLKASGSALAQTDSELYQQIEDERKRQMEHIELIASENFTSPSVMEAQGSLLTNKYAEGYPGRRWYGGCEAVDQIELLAIDRAKRLFGAEHVNVQPHSGSQANMAVYFAVLDPGDKILTMDLVHGGHLTHGHQANFSGRLYEIVHYGVSEADEKIDMDQLEKLARETKPKLITCGSKCLLTNH